MFLMYAYKIQKAMTVVKPRDHQYFLLLQLAFSDFID